MTRRIRKCAAAGALVAALFATSSLRAEDPKPQPFMRASIASVEQINQLATDLGLPVPSLKKLLETQFQFVGNGGLAGDKPVGVTFVAGEKLTDDQMAVIALPVVKNRATVESLTDMGLKPVGKDMATGDGVTFRRTGNYLMFYTGPSDVLAAAVDDPFAADYKAKGTLATASLNFAAFRTAAPTRFKKMLEDMGRNMPPAADANQQAGQEMGLALVRDFVSKTDRMTLSLSQDAQSLHLNTWLMPMEIKGSRKFPKPALQAGAVFTMHVAYPNAEFAQWMPNFIEKLDVQETFNKDGKLTAEQAREFKATAMKFVKLAMAPDAQSMGVSVADGKPVIVVVNQYANDVDFAGQLQSLTADAAKVLKANDAPKFSQMKTAGGKQAWRAESAKGDSPAQVLFVQNGKVVTMVIGEKPEATFDAVAGAAAAGEMNTMLAADLNLEQMLKQVEENMPLPLQDEQLVRVREAVKGKSITLKVQSSEQQKLLYADLAVPTSVLKEASAIAQTMMGGGRRGRGGPASPDVP